MLSSAAAIVTDRGYEQMSVARVTHGARVSRRTFYEVFENREDCFLAVFEEALDRVAARVVPAFEGERVWRERVRAALGELLVLCEEQPRLGALLVVDSLRGGRRVLARRAQVVAVLGGALDGGHGGRRGGYGRARTGRGAPDITGEGVVGAVLSVLHARLLADGPGDLLGLLNPLMSLIVLPYLGVSVSQKELEREVAPRPATPVSTTGERGAWMQARPLRGKDGGDPLAGLSMRLTYRTLRVLGAISDLPGASNRAVGEHAGVHDQGQISKLLARLERLGLIENETDRSGRHASSEPNAWSLTARGGEVVAGTLGIDGMGTLGIGKRRDNKRENR